MKELKNSEKNTKESLETFVRRIKGSKYRLAKLEEDLDWVIMKMYSIPGPSYDRVGSTPSNPFEDRFIILLDKKYRILEKMKKIKEDEVVLHNFENKLTSKELNIFHLYFFKSKSQSEIGAINHISQQCVSQYIDKINNKWKKLC